MSQDARYLFINEADLIRARKAALSFFGGSLDNKRPDAGEQFGYPTEVTFAQLLTAYQRGGADQGEQCIGCSMAAGRACRASGRKGSEDVTPWEEGVTTVLKGINAWAKLRDFAGTLAARRASARWHQARARAIRRRLSKHALQGCQRALNPSQGARQRRSRSEYRSAVFASRRPS